MSFLTWGQEIRPSGSMAKLRLLRYWVGDSPGSRSMRLTCPNRHVVHEQRGRHESGHRDGLWLQQWPERLCGRGNTFMLVES